MPPYTLKLLHLHKSVIFRPKTPKSFPKKSLIKGPYLPYTQPTSKNRQANYISHLTKWYLNSSPEQSHKHFLSDLSNLFATQVGMVNRERESM